MSTADPAPRTGALGRLRRVTPRRLAVLAGVWLALTGGAVLVADALDQPVGAGDRDRAQPAVPGAVAEAPASRVVEGQQTDGTADGGEASRGPAAATGAPARGNAVQLPAFAMVLDHRLPADVAGLNLGGQAEELRRRAMTTNDPVTLVELGSVMQVIGDAQSAEFAYRSALDADPGNLPARVGLAVVPATADRDGLDQAAANPRSQLVGFNQGWVALYAGDVAGARAALRRTVALGEGTRLGRSAATLLTAMETVTFQPAGP
ncbi:MAG TPA: hypothetical protein VFG74_01895 [Miltoncostaeaceae bacterium]|nr:hypothetical protein [Miltoncostaeaceae bacterium]